MSANDLSFSTHVSVPSSRTFLIPFDVDVVRSDDRSPLPALRAEYLLLSVASAVLSLASDFVSLASAVLSLASAVLCLASAVLFLALAFLFLAVAFLLVALAFLFLALALLFVPLALLLVALALLFVALAIFTWHSQTFWCDFYRYGGPWPCRVREEGADTCGDCCEALVVATGEEKGRRKREEEEKRRKSEEEREEQARRRGKVLCIHYQCDRCPYGAGCHFAHAHVGWW